MVVEYIRYTIDEGRAEAFEEAYRRAAEALEASENCERYEVSLQRGPSAHVVRIEWDSGREPVRLPRPGFRSFFGAVGPFVNDIEEMRHYR